MTRSQLPTATNQDCLPAFISLPCAQYPQPNSPQDSIAPEVRVPIREADRATTLRRLCPELPAICQQLSLTSPQPAPCRFIPICVLSSIDIRQRVDACCGASGWLVNGMQGVRGSNPLSSTRHNASPSLPLRVVCQQIVSKSRVVTVEHSQRWPVRVLKQVCSATLVLHQPTLDRLVRQRRERS
jgi:hypothetical protein